MRAFPKGRQVLSVLFKIQSDSLVHDVGDGTIRRRRPEPEGAMKFRVEIDGRSLGSLRRHSSARVTENCHFLFQPSLQPIFLDLKIVSSLEVQPGALQSAAVPRGS